MLGSGKLKGGSSSSKEDADKFSLACCLASKWLENMHFTWDINGFSKSSYENMRVFVAFYAQT